LYPSSGPPMRSRRRTRASPTYVWARLHSSPSFSLALI
jgi:hypothetical protein